MNTFFLLLAATLFSKSLQAGGAIVQISHRLAMKSGEVTPKDFFLDIGLKDGLREGDLVQVYRWVPVMDAYSGRPYHLLRVRLGELRLQRVGEAVSLARIHKVSDPNELPAMDSPSFMLGDQVAFKSDLPSGVNVP